MVIFLALVDRRCNLQEMSPKLIEIGKTYRNRGAGRTTRTVLDIGTHIHAPWLSDTVPPGEPVVKFRQGDKERHLFLCSFARWAGTVVPSKHHNSATTKEWRALAIVAVVCCVFLMGLAIWASHH